MRIFDELMRNPELKTRNNKIDKSTFFLNSNSSILVPNVIFMEQLKLKGTPRQGLTGTTLGFFFGFAAVSL
ncbi:MAG: hypothetical protein K9I68_09490, partial [Bacteroidales bacterium]|nr:hypothetical protein [Bacteroidales bacterium]